MGRNPMITLDTCAILWYLLSPDKLSAKAKKEIIKEGKDSPIIICRISLWEIAMLMKKKRLEINTSFPKFSKIFLSSGNYKLKGITPKIAELSVNLPKDINNDPADRIISATSILNKAPLITGDKNLLNAKSIHTIW